MRTRITKRTVDAIAPADRDQFVWDTDLKGFGLKITPAGRKIYLAQYQVGGRRGPTRRFTLGRHGSPWTAEEARFEVRKILARADLGQDPAADKARRRHEATIAELADRYLAEHVSLHNKTSTAAEATRIVETRIKPDLGSLRLSDLTRARVKEWHQAMYATPYEANRALAFLSKMMTLASLDWELRPDNPCRGIRRFPEVKRERFFTDEELQRIGAALAAAEREKSILPGCISAIRLLALTGCRAGEILSLHWADIDLIAGAIRLRDAKTGARTVALGASALALLSSLPRTGKHVVHGPDPAKPLSLSTLEHAWARIRSDAGVANARLHDFRHTAGTFAAQTGANAFLIRDLLGHKTLSMTGRYVERMVDPVRATADAFSKRVATAMVPDEIGTQDPAPVERAS